MTNDKIMSSIDQPLAERKLAFIQYPKEELSREIEG